MENLNRDQRDTVCKACTLEPCFQIIRITRRKSCTSYEVMKVLIMKLSEHKINILNYTLILIVIQDKSYFNEFFVYYKLQLLATVISAHGEDIETQCSQAISQFPRFRVKNMMCACYSCALRGCSNLDSSLYCKKAEGCNSKS